MEVVFVTCRVLGTQTSFSLHRVILLRPCLYCVFEHFLLLLNCYFHRDHVFTTFIAEDCLILIYVSRYLSASAHFFLLICYFHQDHVFTAFIAKELFEACIQMVHAYILHLVELGGEMVVGGGHHI